MCVFSNTLLRLQNDLHCVGWSVKLYSLTLTLVYHCMVYCICSRRAGFLQYMQYTIHNIYTIRYRSLRIDVILQFPETVGPYNYEIYSQFLKVDITATESLPQRNVRAAAMISRTRRKRWKSSSTSSFPKIHSLPFLISNKLTLIRLPLAKLVRWLLYQMTRWSGNAAQRGLWPSPNRN